MTMPDPTKSQVAVVPTIRVDSLADSQTRTTRPGTDPPPSG